MRPSRHANLILETIALTFGDVAAACARAGGVDRQASKLLGKAILVTEQWRRDTRELTRADAHRLLGEVDGLLADAPESTHPARLALRTHAEAVTLYLRCKYPKAASRAHVARLTAKQPAA